MKIVLISPRSDFLSKNPEFNNFWNNSKYTAIYRERWSGISPGLLVIAALTPSSYDIEIIDENIESLDLTKKYDLVGITAMTHQSIRAYQIADHFKKNNVKVIIGGIHATVLPDEAKKHADSVVVGEAEYLWPELLSDLNHKTLKPFYRSNKIVDLKDTPIPRYDLIKSKNYKSIWIQTSRGCPHDCEFCAATNVYGKQCRYKSVDQILKEIEFVSSNYKNVTIAFSDDNFLANKKRAKVLFKRLSLLNIRWVAETDISIAEDSQFLHQLRSSGCIMLFVGLESLSEEGLKNIDKQNWKYKKLKFYQNYIRKIQSSGIGVMAAFIIGLDNDDSHTFDTIATFLIDNYIYATQISILTPLPGTRLRERLLNENRVFQTDWSNYTFFDVNFIHPKLTKEDLEYGLLNIYKKIYCEENNIRKINYFKSVHKNLIRQGLE